MKGDPTRLRQVVINLVGSAPKFTQAGEVVVKVERLEKSAEGTKLQFSVRDTGIGIPADKQATIFESFTQADSSTTRRYGGTGLGLAISQRLVAMMGGAIGVDSEPGYGSTFWFAVPLERGRAVSDIESRRAHVGEPRRRQAGGPRIERGDPEADQARFARRGDGGRDGGARARRRARRLATSGARAHRRRQRGESHRR